ncbi:MAG: L-seryl-tRNA(Sec) selenium transferase [Candidatus Binatia bacterium]|nr:MAG: L-seryl-tRNA(Sec) selenium transferase [Candidatus Binatia bacterium]
MQRDGKGSLRLPSVDRVLRTPELEDLRRRFSHRFLVDCIRSELASLRGRAGEGSEPPDAARVATAVRSRVAKAEAPPLLPVLNATGVVLHTNLGRAELAEAALDALRQAAGAVALEFDLSTGKRGDREATIREDLVALTGAEAALVVNNNAGALLLALDTLAEGREVVVSRGELVEIGGSFRLPDIAGKSGVRLREVGTTNRTTLEDYERAIGPETALLLKVHTSNYRIVGFTASVPLRDLVALGRRRRIPVVEDLGSGALVDLSAFGLPREPLVTESVRQGADVVTFSGDKLLGGPQAGLVVGRRRHLRRMERNPLKRALRCDKLTLAALGATLRLYRCSPEPEKALPTLRYLTRPLEEIERVARDLARQLPSVLGPDFSIEVVPETSEVGSGALPLEPLPTRAVALRHPRLSPVHIAARFRSARPPVIGRVRKNCFLLDPRTLPDAAAVVDAVARGLHR